MTSLRDDMPDANPYTPQRLRGRVIRPSGTTHLETRHWVAPIVISEDEAFGHWESIPKKRNLGLMGEARG